MRQTVVLECFMVLRVTVASLALGFVVVAQESTVNSYSREKEAALGTELAKDVQRRTHALESDAVQEYVANIGALLRESLPDPTPTFTFSVVTDSLTGTM